MIADMIEEVRPFPERNLHPNHRRGGGGYFETVPRKRAKDWYEFEGKIPDVVSNRLTKELESIISNGFAVLYVIAQKLVSKSESDGYLVGSRGSVGSSFVANHGRHLGGKPAAAALPLSKSASHHASSSPMGRSVPASTCRPKNCPSAAGQPYSAGTATTVPV